MDREVSLFAGAAGRVLWSAVSLQTLVSGLALGGLIFVGSAMLIYAGGGLLVTPLIQLVVALALARYVLNGQYGEWEGTLFSSVGGSWTTVILVASRYLLLSFIWLLPLMLFGLRVEQAALVSVMFGGKAVTLLSLYLVGSVLAPPLLLIASVSAADLGELFSVEHWKRLFGDRLVDLASVYAVYAGGVVIAVALCIPAVLLTFLPNSKFGMLCLGLAGCFVIGLASNLLGRLCGFYALGDFTHPGEANSAAVLPCDSGGLSTVEHDAEPISVPTQANESIPPAADELNRANISAPRPPVLTPSSGAAPTHACSAPPSAVSGETPTAALPALLDASKRVEPILQRFQQDPLGALGALEDLRLAFVPHPQVLVALCICRHRNGEVDEAVKLAKQAVPICFERGHVQLAAQVFKQLRRQVDRLELNREQILIIADALLKKGDLAGAGAAYSTAIGRDSGETRAVRGLLRIADTYVSERAKPEAALKVYEYLLKHCPDSPLVEFAREGLATCQTRLAAVLHK